MSGAPSDDEVVCRACEGVGCVYCDARCLPEEAWTWPDAQRWTPEDSDL